MKQIIEFIRSIYGDGPIPLHEPYLNNIDESYVTQCLQSGFVSSVGKEITEFEKQIADYTGSAYAVAIVNGTSALHLALQVCGVEAGDEVVTQALTFIATANAISYAGAQPAFVDVNEQTLGMSASALQKYLEQSTAKKNGQVIKKSNGQRVSAVVCMHTFGHACEIESIAELCREWGLAFIEDAAEALGSQFAEKALGTFGDAGVFSFNGNKIITTGGGGMIVTNNEETANRARHLSTQAKAPHRYEYIHDEVGYNYRLPNLNAALGLAQMQHLPELVVKQRELAERYRLFFEDRAEVFISEPAGSRSNYWLNAVKFNNLEERNAFLDMANDNKIFARAIWRPMNQLKLYANCDADDLVNTRNLYETVVNIPSTPWFKQ